MKRIRTTIRCRGTIVLALFLLTATACIPKIQLPPYARSLEEYYYALAQAEQAGAAGLAALEQLEAKVCRWLAQQGGDAEMRLLHANVLLARYRRPNPAQTATTPNVGTAASVSHSCQILARGEIPTAILKEVRIAQEVAKSQTDAAAWVLPRSYIVLGDLMLLVAQSRAEDVLRNGNAQQRLILLAHYEVAAAHYAMARKVAGTNKASTVVTQLNYAQSGLFAALTGKANVQRVIDPDSVKATLLDLEEVIAEKQPVWDKAQSYLPGGVLDERDAYWLNQYGLLEEALAFLETDGTKILDSLRRPLRLRVLNAFLKAPADLPNDSATQGIAATLVAKLAPFASKIEISEININPATIKLRITPSNQTGFERLTLPALKLKVGDKTHDVPKPMKDGLGIQISASCDWTITFSNPEAITAAPNESNARSVTQTVKPPTGVLLESNKTLEIYDSLNAKRASRLIP